MKRPYIFAKLEIPPELRTLEGEIKLWRTVLDLTVMDALSKKSSNKQREEALSLLIGATDDHKEHFDFICTLAVLDPDLTKDRISYMLNNEKQNA